jgi:geranylgeranyl pyrophosphate synthase
MGKEGKTAFGQFFSESRKEIGREIAQRNRKLKKDSNLFLKTAREDLAELNEGGKLLRGTLVRLGYRTALHMKGEDASDLCYSNALSAAFEMFQTGVLIHDDIIDNAATRRGRYTIQRRYEQRMAVRGTRMLTEADDIKDVARSAAICIGDYGIYEANRILAEAYAEDPSAAKLIAYFDEVVLNTIRGELLDVILPYELQEVSYDMKEGQRLLEESIRDIYHLKTACYSLIGPLHLGMMLGGADESSMRMMDRFADDVGIAYQIMDDLLGIYADSEVLGKDVGSDIAEFKQTILYMYVRTKKPEYAEDLLRYYGRKHIDGETLSEVRRIFRESGAYDYAQDAMRSCFIRAEKRIGRMSFLTAEDKYIFRDFLLWCQGRKY